MGHPGLVQYDDKLKKYFPAKVLDEGPAMQYIDEYNNEAFWDELIERLVERDLVRSSGIKKLSGMTIDERWTAEDPLREKYDTEFGKNGIENIEIEE
jgi:hypothetical protein